MTDDLYYFDERAAATAVLFIERMLVHIEGPLAGKPFLLQPWQKKITRDLFGWKEKATGARRYRRAFLELPRGNGKSTYASAVALYLLVADGERSAKIYGAAADKNQASLVFNTAREMVKESPWLRRRVRIYRNKTMMFDETSSEYQVLSADAYTKHGLNPHGIIFDELHAQPSRELYDVLATAMGKRKQPLMLMITTAGYDRNSICWEQHEYARQVRDGLIDDPTYYPAIFAADPEDDWTKPEIWKKANPNYGVSVQESFLRQECTAALASPAAQNAFRRLYLNQWTQQESRWLDMIEWDKCNTTLPDLRGRKCYGGLDLATTTDIAALVLAFPPEEEGEPLWLLPFMWIPKDNMLARTRRDRVPYEAWTRDGQLKATAGNVIDYDVILEDIKALGEQYGIAEIAFDRWGATQISAKLMALGFDVVAMGQGFASMAAPTKELLRMVLARQVGHGGHAVLRWMADNVTVEQDAAGNVKPSKARSAQRIDGIVASIMAIDRATRGGGQEESVYEERGIRSI